MEKFTPLRTQCGALLTLAMLAMLVKSPAAKTRWLIATGFGIIAAVFLSCYCTGFESRNLSLSAFFIVNIFYLFYITSSIENRLIQFIPVAFLTIFSLIFLSSAPGTAMVGSGIAFGVGSF